MKNLKETDIKSIKDKRGNIVISPGLKVRHKKSQFEYTVNKVVKKPNGELVIMLADPEAPRFRPAKSSKVLSDKTLGPTQYHVDAEEDASMYYAVPDTEAPSKVDLFAVSAEEFEKEYEVK